MVRQLVCWWWWCYWLFLSQCTMVSLTMGQWWRPGGSGSCGGGGSVRRLAANTAGNESINGCMKACDGESIRWKTTQQPTNKEISKSGRWWTAMMATLRRNGDATATMMDSDGRCNGNALVTTAMERGGDNGGAPMSGGWQQRQRYGATATQWRLLWMTMDSAMATRQQ